VSTDRNRAANTYFIRSCNVQGDGDPSLSVSVNTGTAPATTTTKTTTTTQTTAPAPATIPAVTTTTAKPATTTTEIPTTTTTTTTIAMAPTGTAVTMPSAPSGFRADGYNINRDGRLIAAGSLSTYTDRPGKGWHTYYVRAYNRAGTSVATRVITVKVS
jgi:hypothetical protein